MKNTKLIKIIIIKLFVVKFYLAVTCSAVHTSN